MTTSRPSSLPSLPRLLVLGSAVGVAFVVCGAVPRPAAGEGGKRAASVYSRRAAARLAEAAAAATAAAAAPTAGASGGDEAAQAERIVASSLAKIGQAETVAIRLRQRVRLGNRVLVGVGRYLQAGQGEEQRFRFETSLTSDSESFEITEVSDGIFCWLHRRVGPDPPSLHRIDIQRVRSRLEELGAPDPADTAPYLGGLQRNLWWIRQWFRFQEAAAGEIDGRPVWLVEGRWQPEILKVLLPDLVTTAGPEGEIRPEQLPDGFPWAVRLAIGQSDLLPSRFEFLGVPGERPVAPAPPEPIAVVEFLEVVLDGAVDATAFFYQPASEELVDLTGPTVKMLGLMRP